jgi:hypothetical protein
MRRGVLCAAGKGEKTGLRRKKNENPTGGAAAAKNGEESDGFRFRFFLYFFTDVVKIPPPLA